MSCDLLPTESPGPHYQGDVRDVLFYGWDLMIAHPDCTHLSVSGAAWFKGKRVKGLQQAAVSFVRELDRAQIEKVCIENPVSVLSTLWRKPDQIIHPSWFGHMEQKTTCLWLKNLKKLEKTNDVTDEMMKLPERERMRLHYMPPQKDRGKKRSLTYPGVADAMVEQWGAYET